MEAIRHPRQRMAVNVGPSRYGRRMPHICSYVLDGTGWVDDTYAIDAPGESWDDEE